MSYAWLLYRLRLKAGVRSAFFLTTAALLVGLAFVFCALLPARPAVSLSVGLLAEDDVISAAAAQTLNQNGDYRFVPYNDAAAMERGVLTGELHCAYRIAAGEEKPVTLWKTEGSYMCPILNEIVLAAYMEATAPELTAESLTRQGIAPPEDMRAALAERAARITPVTVELSAPEGDSRRLERTAEGGLQTLLYAVLGAMFAGATVLSALLRGREAQPLLPAGHAAAGALAPLLADVTLGLAALLAADSVIAVMNPGAAAPFVARAAGLAALAAISALLGVPALLLARRPSVPLLCLPLVTAAWVLLSGAVADPRLLPWGLGALRFFSPPWYCLRIIEFLSR